MAVTAHKTAVHSGTLLFEHFKDAMASGYYSDLMGWKDPQLTGAVFAAGNLFFLLWGLGCAAAAAISFSPE